MGITEAVGTSHSLFPAPSPSSMLLLPPSCPQWGYGRGMVARVSRLLQLAYTLQITPFLPAAHRLLLKWRQPAQPLQPCHQQLGQIKWLPPSPASLHTSAPPPSSPRPLPFLGTPIYSEYRVLTPRYCAHNLGNVKFTIRMASPFLRYGYMGHILNIRAIHAKIGHLCITGGMHPVYTVCVLRRQFSHLL